MRLKRVGHGGTLDPAATGVLPIALGKATRLLQFLRQDKAYQATIRLGISTTTDDLEGEIIATQPASGLSLEQTVSALKLFEGKIQQVPPSYSAIQVQGKRLYDLARAGEKIEVPARTVEVFKIEILDWRPGDFLELEVAIACGAGTYIRAIARDLGAALQTGGTLAALTRTQSSGLHLSDSLTFDELEAQLQPSSADSPLGSLSETTAATFQPIPPAVALQHLGAVTLPAAVAQRWCQGQRVPWNDAPVDSKNSPLRVYHEGGRFLGIGHLVNSDAGQLLIPQMVFDYYFSP